MSEFKHTPGPWEVVNGCDVFTKLGASNREGIRAAANDGWQIADCSGFPTSAHDGECTLSLKELYANARLIAAAPDLLEALLKIDATLVYSMDHARSSLERKQAMSKCSDMARAAIAKATGGEA